MFRKRQDLDLQESKVVIEIEEIVNEDGEYVHQGVEQNKNLPDSELFDLGNIIDAGIEPEEVDSKVLKASSVNADTVVRKYTKKETNE